MKFSILSTLLLAAVAGAERLERKRKNKVFMRGSSLEVRKYNSPLIKINDNFADVELTRFLEDNTNSMPAFSMPDISFSEDTTADSKSIIDLPEDTATATPSLPDTEETIEVEIDLNRKVNNNL